MPAPTALEPFQSPPATTTGEIQEPNDAPLLFESDRTSTDQLQVPETMDDSEMQIDVEGRPNFAPASDTPQEFAAETRKVPIPPHRFSPLKNTWNKIYPPLVNHLKLQGKTYPLFSYSD